MKIELYMVHNKNMILYQRERPPASCILFLIPAYFVEFILRFCNSDFQAKIHFPIHSPIQFPNGLLLTPAILRVHSPISNLQLNRRFSLQNFPKQKPLPDARKTPQTAPATNTPSTPQLRTQKRPRSHTTGSWDG